MIKIDTNIHAYYNLNNNVTFFNYPYTWSKIIQIAV